MLARRRPKSPRLPDLTLPPQTTSHRPRTLRCLPRQRAVVAMSGDVGPSAADPVWPRGVLTVSPPIDNVSVMEPTSYGVMPPERLDVTFAALADPTRRAILARLASGEASVMELAEPFAMSQPAISKHLKVLERAGLISRGRDAQRRPCRLEAKPLAEATEWLEGYRRFWEASFERLDALLDELKTEEKNMNAANGKGEDR